MFATSSLIHIDEIYSPRSRSKWFWYVNARKKICPRCIFNGMRESDRQSVLTVMERIGMSPMSHGFDSERYHKISGYDLPVHKLNDVWVLHEIKLKRKGMEALRYYLYGNVKSVNAHGVELEPYGCHIVVSCFPKAIGRAEKDDYTKARFRMNNLLEEEQ